MAKDKVVTARIDATVSERLDALAASTDRSRAWLVAQAVARYVEEELAFAEFVQVGIDDLDAGRWISHDDLTQQIRQRRAQRKAA